MNKTYVVLGIILLFCSLYLVVGGILIDRMEFTLMGFVGAFGCGECIKLSQRTGGKNE